MPNPTFSAEEAQALVNHAHAAPLQNLIHASEVSALLQKFKTWYEHAMAELSSMDKKIAEAVKVEIEKLKADV